MPSLPRTDKPAWHKFASRDNNKAPGKHTKLYASARWRNLRRARLDRQPLCVACNLNGRPTIATVLDHIKPVNQGGDFWDESNHQPLCNSCHAKKSQTEGSKPFNK